MTQRLSKRYLDCTDMTMIAAESYGLNLAEWQQSVMWWLGDLARFSERNWPDTHHQVWPDWVSPGLIARAKAVSEAYPNQEDREHEATWTQFMRVAGKTDRQELLAAIVFGGLTTDESAKVNSDEPTRRLLAIDVNYYLHQRWHTGLGVESAREVSTWIHRTVERMRSSHRLSDVACCFDSPWNHRKGLTADWEDKYKPRPPKEHELIEQLRAVKELLIGNGYCCVEVGYMEADDVMASFGNQFNGAVILLTADKDLKQCLSKRVVLLKNVTWSEDETSGDMIPEYHWFTASPSEIPSKDKDEEGYIPKYYPNLRDDTGLLPSQFPDLQCLMGDGVDGIKGAIGVGEKGALMLMQKYGSAEASIEAAKDPTSPIKPAQRKALIEFESKLEVTLQLVTLRTDLKIPSNTRI